MLGQWGWFTVGNKRGGSKTSGYGKEGYKGEGDFEWAWAWYE